MTVGHHAFPDWLQVMIYLDPPDNGASHPRAPFIPTPRPEPIGWTHESQIANGFRPVQALDCVGRHRAVNRDAVNRDALQTWI